jgi:hypothetical protein
MPERQTWSTVVVPDVPSAIRGWRRWNRVGSRLVGFGTCVWPPDGPLEASCHVAGPHDPPTPCRSSPSDSAEGHLGHGCGIYAYRTLEDAMLFGAMGSGTVLGEVEVWGRVHEHQRGYRAQFARPRRLLWVPGEVPWLAFTALADVYAVPVAEAPEAARARLRPIEQRSPGRARSGVRGRTVPVLELGP